MVLTALDVHVCQLLRDLGFAATPIGEPVYYMGSLTQPVIFFIDECREARCLNQPANYALFYARPATLASFPLPAPAIE